MCMCSIGIPSFIARQIHGSPRSAERVRRFRRWIGEESATATWCAQLQERLRCAEEVSARSSRTDARELSATRLATYKVTRRRLRTFDAFSPNGKLSGISETHDSAVERDRKRTS